MEERAYDLQNHHGRPAYACNAYAHSSVEQVQLKEHAPFGSQQMILLYLEMFLIT